LPSALELLLLLPEAQTFDYVSVSLNIILFDIIEESSSLTNKLQQTATGMMILLMRLKMLCQVFNPGAQKSNLDFRRTGILFVKPIICN
jgi:hypothetical protein